MINFKPIKYTIGLIAGQRFITVIISVCLTTALFVGCRSNTAAPDNNPAFSAMAPLGDKLYVAYKLPIVRPGKSDTITISFSYNASKVKSIDVVATLDSQKTWISLASIIPQSSNKAAMTWIPKDDSVSFAYFGKKEALIRIRDTILHEHIDSDSFFICGKVPFILNSPHRKETFSINDTIPILYSQNGDRSSNITAGFLIGNDTGYVDISDKNETIKVSESLPIKNFVTKFVPLDFTAKAKNYATPIAIFIADYGGASVILKADSITIH